MAVKGKVKGNSYERVVSKILNDLYGMADAFTRSLSSGARFGGKNSVKLNKHKRSASMNELGDIATPDGIELIVECKAYKSLAFHQIIQGKCKQLDDWLNQVNNDNDTFESVFNERLAIVLVFKINRAGTYFVIPKKQIIKAFIDKEVREQLPKIEYIFRSETYLILQQEHLELKAVKKAFINSTKA